MKKESKLSLKSLHNLMCRVKRHACGIVGGGGTLGRKTGGQEITRHAGLDPASINANGINPHPNSTNSHSSLRILPCLGFAPRSQSFANVASPQLTQSVRYPDSLRSVRPQIRSPRGRGGNCHSELDSGSPNNQLDCFAAASNDENFSRITPHPSRKSAAFTLAEVFHPLRRSSKIASRIIRDLAGVTSGSTRRAGFAFAHTAPYRKFGFTLAEVLITLGIIGVVAALTIPQIVANHQKKTFVTRLKKSYSTISNALQIAQIDYGDISQWDYVPDAGSDATAEDKKQKVAYFCQKYLIPYLSVLEDCGHSRCNGNKNVDYYYPSGQKLSALTGCANNQSNAYSMITSDGVLYCIAFDTNPNILMIEADVNGISKPNKYGKDVFVMTIRDYKFSMFYYGQYDLLENCKSMNGFSCGRIIMENGWELPKDYPW